MKIDQLPRRLMIAAVILLIASLACNLPVPDDVTVIDGTTLEPADATNTPPLDLPTETPVPPTPTEEIPPAPEAALMGVSCVPGTWTVDHASYINHLNTTVVSQMSLPFSYLDATGDVIYQFGDDGVLLIEIEDWNVSAEMSQTSGDFTIDFDIAMTVQGSITTTYTLTDTGMTFSDSISDLNMDVQVNGTSIGSSEFGMYGGSTATFDPVSGEYDCEGDMLEFNPDYPNIPTADPLILRREQ